MTKKELTIPTRRWDRDMDRGVWSQTHNVGRLALEDGRFGGILYTPYPSTRLLGMKEKQNVAVFMDPASPAMSLPLHESVELEVEDRRGVLEKLGIRC